MVAIKRLLNLIQSNDRSIISQTILLELGIRLAREGGGGGGEGEMAEL